MSLFILSVGGSIVIQENIHVDFLKAFKAFILDQVAHGHRFVIIPGGGSIARKYQRAAAAISTLAKEDIDWLGIHATRLNAHLLRSIFREVAHPKVFKDPTEPITAKEPVIIGTGWKPGWSTDYDAVLFAKNFRAKTIINLTNTDFIYDKDPRKHPDAKVLKEVSWPAFRALVGDTWDPGLNVPFDPIASKEAEALGLKVVILDGTNIKNLEACLAGKPFQGSVIR